MPKAITKYVNGIIGKELCVDAEDGEKVFEVIKSILSSENKVILSFKNVSLITSSFLNNAIGLLYRDYDEKTIKNFVEVKDLDDTDIVLLKHVVDSAKMYYKDPNRMENLVKEAMEK